MELAVEIQKGAFNKQTSVAVVSRVISTLMTPLELRDRTIHIRLAGVDAPEASHFGRPAQQFSAESLAWLKSQVEGKTVYCQIFRKDQYSRIVAMPYLKPRLLPGWLAKGKCIPVEMLKAGWAMTYEQAGAEYGQWSKEDFLQMQSEAQAAKRGIWKYGNLKETPAEYKRRYASGVEQAEAAIEPSSPASSKPPLWRRLIGLR
ncbi:hypothetical protein QCA50_019147 [Cerrena zonata]|uniref:TNase-like domain-containing protein n=1 Tax=Cerrena zonata TaxID=2478898 RepID=A0AAW0F9N0_9APHY